MLRARIEQIVRMDDKAEEAVAAQNDFDLAVPEVQGIGSKNVMEAIVLDAHDGKLEDFSNEERLGGATAAGLRFEMTGVGNGHVVGKFEGVVPIQVAVEDAGAVAGRVKLPGVKIDACRAPQKFLAIAEQIAIVIDVVDIDFEAALSKEKQKVWRDGVALFWDDLEGGFDAERIVNIHEMRTEVEASAGFDVVGHDGSGGRGIGPKPDEGNAFEMAGANGSRHEALEEAVNGLIDRPMRERRLLPGAQSKALEVFADSDGQSGPDGVVRRTESGIALPAIGGKSGAIALVTEILDDFVGIEGKETSIAFNSGIDRHVGQGRARVRTNLSGREHAEASKVRTKPKEPFAIRQRTGQAKINQGRWTTEILEE